MAVRFAHDLTALGVAAHRPRGGSAERASVSLRAASWPSSLPGTGPAPVREYLNISQLAELTPWSVSGIEKMVSRGVLVRDVHYFQPFGHRTQLIFKWSAIVALMEGPTRKPAAATAQVLRLSGTLGVEQASAGPHGLARGNHDTHRDDVIERRGQLDVQKATSELNRLLGR